jgi:hypothetical protein
MPLINLRTNLKTTSEYTSTDPNLTYGHDRKDFGSSNQPFMVTPIPEGNDNVPSSPDFLLRNGFLNPVNSIKDSLRITKFLNPFGQGASARGVLFIAKQELLERQNVKVENGFTRVFNPLQPIAQAGVLSIGYHLNKQGINIFRNGYFNGGREGYFEITKTDSLVNNSYQIGINRLVSLFNVKQNLLATSETDTIGRTKYDISSDSSTLLSYPGGPGSILGIGKTNIRIQNPLAFKTNIPDTSNSTIFSYPIEKTPETYLAPDSADIKKIYTGEFGGYITPIDSAFNTPYKGSKTYFKGHSRNGVTKEINPNLSVSPDNDFEFGDDIIDFQFQLINNNGAEAANPNTILNFRAYIDDFSDSFTGDWEAYKYVGRGENFYKYKGFTRDMNVSFTAPILSRADVINTYQKLNGLIWATTPDYSDVGLMRGTLVKFTMGDYLRDAIVVIKSLQFSPIMEMGFDINRRINGERFALGNPSYVGQLPKGIKVTANIIPLTQGVTGDVEGTEKTLYYTPQRGEAFVGNRKHVIKDRPGTIGAQYKELSIPNGDGSETTVDPAYTPDNPGASKLITLQDPNTAIQQPTLTEEGDEGPQLPIDAIPRA